MSDYWEARYRAGGNSGHGSYGRLGAYKAKLINGIVERRGIRRVIEFGCGDGEQVSLGAYPEYVGIDTAPTAIALCKARFADDPTKSFYLRKGVTVEVGAFDLALSLDVVYHLLADAEYEAHMADLFMAAPLVLIYAPNREGEVDMKHEMRFRRFTDWTDDHFPTWRRRYWPNPIMKGGSDFWLFERP